MENENLRDYYIRRDTLRMDGNHLADWMMETYTLDEVEELFCWICDRLGNKHDVDVIKFINRINETVENVYEKIPKEIYDSMDEPMPESALEFLDIIDNIRNASISDLGEYDETPGSDDCSLWDEIDDNDESED